MTRQPFHRISPISTPPEITVTLEPLAKFSDVVEKKQNGLILFEERAPRS
jgi:hypothetical protein